MKFLFLILSALSIPVLAGPFLESSSGSWSGLSKNIYSIYGDITIGEDSLSFTLKDSFQYDVVRKEAHYVILKLNRPIDCDSEYVRLGPISEKYRKKNMEFSVISPKHIDNALNDNEIIPR